MYFFKEWVQNQIYWKLLYLTEDIPHNNPQQMIQTILQIENGKYPFEQPISQQQIIRVEDIHYFSSLKDLTEKKNEIIKKNSIINTPYLIKLLKIYQSELSLHYIYENIPYSLTTYIQKHYNKTSSKSVEGNAKIFIKKISCELTMLISYLANMKIQIDISINNFGVTYDQKLKVFMSSRCKMGHKTEVSLVAFYSSRKQKILIHIQNLMNQAKNEDDFPPNFYIKSNKLVFPPTQINESINFGSSEQLNQSNSSSNAFDSNIYSTPLNHSTSSCIDPRLQRNNNLRQTAHNFSRYFKQKQVQKAKQTARSANKDNKSHKNSFQFGKSKKDNPYEQSEDDNKSDTKSYTHSKSIRIELQQKIDPNLKKARKDSYKVKITTFHEYQMQDCNPQTLFGNVPKNQEDIFQFFSKQAAQKPKQPSHHRDHYQFDQLSSPFSPKASKAAFSRKQSMPQQGYMSSSTSVRTLQQKVRLAKQKAQSVLSRYLIAKKKTTAANQQNFC